MKKSYKREKGFILIKNSPEEEIAILKSCVPITDVHLYIYAYICIYAQKDQI